MGERFAGESPHGLQTPRKQLSAKRVLARKYEWTDHWGVGQLTVAASSLGYLNRDGGEKGIRDARLVGGKAPVIAWRSRVSRVSGFL